MPIRCLLDIGSLFNERLHVVLWGDVGDCGVCITCVLPSEGAGNLLDIFGVYYTLEIGVGCLTEQAALVECLFDCGVCLL